MTVTDTSTTTTSSSSSSSSSTIAAPGLSPTDGDLDRLSTQRFNLATRHSRALTGLMETRVDLRGVHAMADFVDESVRWTA